MNEDPAKDGLHVGQFLGAPVYVGRAIVKGVLDVSRIQITEPRGAYQVYGNFETFVNDPTQMWYLKKSCNHVYDWVTASNGQLVPFAIDNGDEVIDDGYTLYTGRTILNGSVQLGPAVTWAGEMYYADFDKRMQKLKTYEVLTCKSKVCMF